MRRKRNISSERKASYYAGMTLSVIGLLLFLSVFVTVFVSFGEFGDVSAHLQSFGLRAFGGMVLMIGGGFLMRLGSRGLAGSGVILDPEKAREDVEPWSRMAGGVVKDALDEAEIEIGRQSKDAELSFDEKLRRLHRLYKDGILSQEEYEREKREILDRN